MGAAVVVVKVVAFAAAVAAEDAGPYRAFAFLAAASSAATSPSKTATPRDIDLEVAYIVGATRATLPAPKESQETATCWAAVQPLCCGRYR